MNSNRGFISVKSENWLIGELENLLIIRSRAFTSVPVKIFRHLGI